MTPTDWLDLHAGAVQGVSAAVLVLVTAVLVWVTTIYARSADRQAEASARQVEETRRQRFDQQRPVVHPVGELPLLADQQVDWNRPDIDLRLANVGAGAALIVCGVLFPPTPDGAPRTLPERYTLWRAPLLPPGGSERPLKAARGMTIMNGDATIGGHQLFAPRKPSRQAMLLGGEYNIPARLTLTYQDIFGRKHGAVFDYIDRYGWQGVALLEDISTDLEALDDQARAPLQRPAGYAGGISVPSSVGELLGRRIEP